MYIIWRGKGWLVPVIFLGSISLMQFISSSLYGKGAYTEMPIFEALAISVSLFLIALLSYKVNIEEKAGEVDGSRENTEKKSFVRRLLTGRRSTLFFIPIQYWLLIIPCFLSLADYRAEQEQNSTQVYLQQPEVDDFYVLDMRKLNPKETTDGLFYGVMRVESTSDSMVKFVVGTHTFLTILDAKKRLRKYDPAKPLTRYKPFPRYVSDKHILNVSKEKIQELYQSGAIEVIYRDL